MKRAPAHAGGLRRPERMLIALVLLLMATLIGGLAVTAEHQGGPTAAAAPGVAASSRAAGTGAAGTGAAVARVAQHVRSGVDGVHQAVRSGEQAGA